MAQKIIDAVKNFIEKIKSALGKTDSAETDEMETLVKAWETAIKNAEKEVKTAKIKTLNSTNTELNALEKSSKKLGEQLYDWEQGKFNKNYFDICKTPNIIQKYGKTNDLPIVMIPHVVTKVTEKKHKVAIKTLTKIPFAISDPIMIFNGSVENSLLILTELRDRDSENIFETRSKKCFT